MDQKQMPLVEKLIQHIKRKPENYHVPGHKGGSLLSGVNEVDDYFRQLLRMDLTEISGLDDLHSAEDVIKEAQSLLATLYGAKRSFFLINGSTVGNLAMICGTLNRGDRVLVQRNSHKSILNGLRLIGAEPIFILPEFNQEWGISEGVSYTHIEEALSKYEDIKAVILTYPSYYGTVYPLEDIIALCREKKVLVLVDEAHGAHFIASTRFFPPSSLQLGADVVIQSAHKTLPALTMGAFLHIQGDRVDEDSIQEYLSMLQSSSPSYVIMASLDMARFFVSQYTEEDGKHLVQRIKELKKKLSYISGLAIMPTDDPLKLALQFKHMSGYQLQELLEKRGIYTELADPLNVLFVLPLLRCEDEDRFNKIIDALQEVSTDIPNAEKEVKVNPIPSHSELVEVPEGAMIVTVPFASAIGEISARMVTPYPPGIPLIYKGERITKEHITSLQGYLNKGARIQNKKNLEQSYIEIYKTARDKDD